MAHDMMEVLAGTAIARRAQQGGTLACTDAAGLSCADGDGRYTLIVTKDRQPGLGARLIRALWPLSTHVQ